MPDTKDVATNNPPDLDEALDELEQRIESQNAVTEDDGSNQDDAESGDDDGDADGMGLAPECPMDFRATQNEPR